MRICVIIILLEGLLWGQCMSMRADNIRIHVLGDSTMEQQDASVKDQRGWPQLLPAFFTSDVTVLNYAKSGTSSKTFYEGAYWKRAKKAIVAGDYVFIQFGHNDEKHGGKDGEVGTVPTDSYRFYLRKYIEEVKGLGAYPVLFTPVVRCMIGKDGKVTRRGMHDLGEHVHRYEDSTFDEKDTVTYNYSYNMKLLAREMKCPCIDMTALTAFLVNKLGKNLALKLIYNLPNDGTHFGVGGALLFSQTAVGELKKQHILEKYIIESPEMVVVPTKLDLGSVYAGTFKSKVIDICCLSEKKETGNIYLSANGIDLSTNSQEFIVEGSVNERMETLSFPYKIEDKFVCYKVYANIIPKIVGPILADITIKKGKETVYIPVSGECAALENNKKFSVAYKLQGNAKPQVNGIVIGQTQKWHDMVFEKYAYPDAGSIIDKENKYTKSKVQYNRIKGDVWPGNEIDIVHSRYIQFGIQAVEGSILHVESLSMLIGGVKYRVVCSKDEDFVHGYTLGEWTANGGEMRKQLWQIDKQVKSGEKLFIRIYPWSQEETIDRSLCLHDIVIKGYSSLE